MLKYRLNNSIYISLRSTLKRKIISINNYEVILGIPKLYKKSKITNLDI